jgi:signal peptidase I
MALAARLSAYARELVQGLLLRKDTTPRPEVPAGAGRRQLEGFAVAIAMALMLKQFTFDTFQVPTESMEPAIIGRGDWGDRLLVDRFAYMFKDPERYDILVFHYPLSRLVNYVKRGIGLPGEHIRIFHGNVYAAPNHGKDLKITRKPDSVQEAIFRSHPVIPAEDTEDLDASRFFKSWDAEDPERRSARADVSFDASEKSVVLRSDAGKEGTVRTKEPIKDGRHDPQAAKAQGKGGNTEPVGDLRVSVKVTARDCDAVILEIQDPVSVRRPLRLEIGVEGRGQTKLVRGSEDLTPATLKDVRIAQGRATRVEFDNVDCRLVVRIDGNEAARVDYEVPPIDSPAMNDVAAVRVGVRSGSASFSKLAIFRDLYYTRYFDPTFPDNAPLNAAYDFEVPDGMYLMFGDNSPNSLDARGWRRSRIRVRQSPDDPGVVLEGDFEAVSDRIENTRRMQNPFPDDHGRPAFIDVFGNQHHLKPGLFDVLERDTNEVAVDTHGRKLAAIEDIQGVENPKTHAILDHYVPRSYIVGRASIVFFWPPRILR